MGGSRNPKCGKTYYVGRSLYMTASYLTPLVLTLNLMPLVSRTLERADPLAGMVAVMGVVSSLGRTDGVAGQLLGMFET